MAQGSFIHRGPAEVKRLVIEALQEHFAQHPVYASPDGPGITITNKFAHKERSKRQIVVTTASAAPQRTSLSADFGGRIYSSVILGRLIDKTGSAVEWAVENPFQRLRPAPGIYLVETDTEETFFVAPHYAVGHEILYPYIDRVDSDKVKIALKHIPVESGSELLMLDEHLPLEKDKDYVIDYQTGIVTLAGPIPDARMLSAEYRWLGESSGPFTVARQVYDVAALPGVILNFGRKVQAGSQQAVVVTAKPEYVADFWTGRWTISVNLDIYTQDPLEQDELAEEVAMAFWYWNAERWADQGMSLSEPPDIGGGSDTEEDEIAGEYAFQNSVTLTVIVDWEAFVPCLRKLRVVNISGYGLSPFDSPVTSMKKNLDAKPEGQFGNIIDRNTLPGKGVQVIQDPRRYIAGPCDPKLGQLYREMLGFDAKRASNALGNFYESVRPNNPDAPNRPVNFPDIVPVSEFKDEPDTDGPGVFSSSVPVSLDELPPHLRDELRRVSGR